MTFIIVFTIFTLSSILSAKYLGAKHFGGKNFGEILTISVINVGRIQKILVAQGNFGVST